MHVALTDALACPKCGPGWGLILIAKNTVERRALDGFFGCANCRQEWVLKDGYAEFIEGDVYDDVLPAPSSEQALLMAAALGIVEGPASVVVIGSGVVNARQLSQMVEGMEVIAVSRALASEAEANGVSRIGAGARLPFREGFAKGVVLSDEASLRFLEQSATVVGMNARVVALSGEASVAARMTEAGLRMLMRDENVTVAQRTTF